MTVESTTLGEGDVEVAKIRVVEMIDAIQAATVPRPLSWYLT
jgi:hypothetical protein